jgi:general secretion pathway protein A
MTTPEKFSTYLMLIGLNADSALVLNEQQQKITMPLAKIGRDWTGEVVYVWKKPPAFSETLFLGDSSPTVAWIAQQFAKLDKQKEPLADDLFSLALHERIKMFQRVKNITADGNINEQTLMKINETIGADKTLIADFVDTDQTASGQTVPDQKLSGQTDPNQTTPTQTAPTQTEPNQNVITP